MHRIRTFWACAIVPTVCALLVRDDAPRNLTTTAQLENTQTSVPPEISWSTVTKSPLNPSANFKVHRESSAIEFDQNQSASIDGSPSQDIGSIIESFLTTAIIAGESTLHLRPTQGAAAEVTTPARQVPADVRPANTGLPAASVPQITPPPTITRDGFTIRPVPFTSASTVTKDGQVVGTTQVVDFQFVAGSSTLSVGSPVTVSGVVIALTTDASRSTVLVVGDTTTTLSGPVQALAATQAADASTPISISTTVIEGTTKYVIAGQTLAPGQPITVDNVPISITTSDGSTVLVLGDVTTTFVGGLATQTGPGGTGPTTAVPSVTGNNGIAKPTSATKIAAASALRGFAKSVATIAVLLASVQNFN